MNLHKKLKFMLIITLWVMFFCCPKIYAYYSTNDSKSVTIGTKNLIISGSTSATTYSADSTGVVSIPVTIKNESGFAVNYKLTLSNTNLKFNDDSTAYIGTIAANTTSTVTLKIVEINPLGTENTDIDMAVTGPYTKNIDIGSYVLTYDLTPPSCSMSISGPIKTGSTSTLTVTCTDASGIKTTSLATSAISLSSSLGTLSNPQATAVTNGYKYTFTYTAGSKAGTETFTLLAGKVSDNVNNKNASKTTTLTVQRDVRVTFNLNGANSFTYSGTKYMGTTTLTLCTLSSETTCSVTMPTITAPTNTPTVIGWSTAAGTHTATYTSGQKVSISTNLNLYAQTSKAGITRKATFSCNGGTGSVSQKTCSIAATYNGTHQGTSCSVDLPTSGCENAPWEFQGWNTNSNAKSGATGSVSINSDKTYYAIWEKVVTVTFNKNGCATANQSGTMALYNGATSGNITVPTATMNTNWTTLGASTSSGATGGTAMGNALNVNVASANTTATAYYICQKNVTVTFNKNNCTTENGSAAMKLYNGGTSGSVIVPTKTMNTSWTTLGASSSTSSTSSGTAMGKSMSISGVASSATSVTRYYNCKKDVTVTFNKNGCTTADQSGTMVLYNGGTSSNVVVPSATLNSGWTNLGASTNSSATSGTAVDSSLSISGVTSSSTAATAYYTCKKNSKTYTMSFNTNLQNNALYNVSATAPSSVSCTIPAVYNGATQAASCSVTLPTFSYETADWDFNGWGTSASSTSGDTIGTSVSISGNTTRYATWSKTMTVTFKANGCTTSDKSTSKTLYNFPASYSVTVPSATMNSGWTNLGASESASSTSSGTAMGSTISGIKIPAGSGSSKTYYYNCSKASKTYTAKFSCNGGTGTVANDTCTIPAVYNGASQATTCEITLPSTGCSMSGFEFLGWNLSSTATTGVKGGSVEINSNKQYYAIYRKAAKTYKLTFNGNGGTGSTSSVSCTIPAVYNGADQATTCDVTLPSNGFSYSGWTFNGWGTSSTSTSGTAAGTKISISASSTRYAIWKKSAITYTVSFNGNGGTGSTASKSCTIPAVYNGATQNSSCSVTLPSSGYSYDGWAFHGWGTSSSSISGTAAGTAISISSNITRYAIWYQPPISYTVTFNANGGTGNTDPVACTILAAYNGEEQDTSCVATLATTNGFTRSGWNFVGWGTSSSSTSGESLGAKVTLTSNKTYYAIWKKPAITYTLSFASAASGASGSTASKSCTIPAVYNGATQASSCSITLPSNGFSYSGWTFNGWGTSSTSTNGTAAGTAVSISANSTRYATWKKSAITYTAKFSCNGGTGTVANDTCTISAVYNGASQATSCDITLPSTGCSMTGFEFIGWNTSSTGTTGGKGGSVSINSNKQYYAIYEKNVSVTFNSNGCTTSNGSTTFKLYNGGTSGSVTVPSATMNTNWTTLGASASSSSTSSGTAFGSRMTISGVAASTTSVTRYYNCKKDVTVSFNKNSCTTANQSGTMTLYNGATSGSITVPNATMNTNWTSLGASASSSATSGTAMGKSMSISGIASATTSATRYYNCKKDVTVTFNKNGCTSANQSGTMTLYNGATSGSITVPSATMNSGWTNLGASTSSSATSGSSSLSISGVTSSTTTASAYYICKKNSITYTMSFNGNGGTGSTASKSCTISAVYNGATQASSCSITLPSNGFSYSGWTFNGWGTSSTSTSGSGSGTSVSISGNTTRYATWKKPAITYTLSFGSAASGASGSTASKSCTIEAVYNGATQGTSCSVTLPSNGFSYSGWTFNGWGTSSSSTSGSSAGTSVTLTSSATRYATWAKTVTVQFNKNSCTVSDGNRPEITIYNGATSLTTTVTSAAMVSGWTSLGVSSSSSSTSQGIADGGSITITGIGQTQTRVERYRNCKKDVTVTFKANSCTTGDKTTTKTLYNGASSTSVTVPSATMKSNWTYLGASANAASTSSGTAMGSSMSISGISDATTSVTRYYNCKKDVTVTFNKNGCTTTSPTASMTLYNGSTSGMAVVPSATLNSGWTNLGASTSSSATSGTAVNSALNVSGVSSSSTTANAYYTCKKNSKTYTVTFSCNGGTGTVSSTSCTIPAVYNGATQGTTCSINAPTSGCSRSGWNFVGWNTSDSGTTGFTGAASINQDRSYYAIWKKPAITYTLSFASAASGASGSTASKTCTIPAVYNGATQGTSCSITLPTNGFSYSGWTFNGWGTSSTSTSGSGSGASVSISSNSTRYATWYKPSITYTASFNANGGSGNTNSVTCKINAVYNGDAQATSCVATLATSNGFTRSGWTFAGWGTSSSSTSGESLGARVTLTGNKTYYAIWKKPSITYTLSFESAASGASGSTASKTCTIPAVYNGATQGTSCSITLPTNGFSYSGWTFNGWGTSSSSTSGSGSGASVSISGNTTRYATWKKSAITYTATFSCNGGSGTVSSTSCTIPAVYNGATQNSTCSITTPSSGCSRSGWDFIGWSTSDSGTSGFTGAASINQNRSYYAIWKKPAITYTLSFESAASGASGSTSSKSCTIPAVYNGATQGTSCSITLPSNGFSYSGWTFNGWGTSSSSTSGSGSGASVSISGNTTRYATWKKSAITYTASFSCNGGSGTVSSTSCTIPAVYNGATQNSTCSITTPSSGCSRSGWNFEGWSTSSSGTSGITGAVSISQDRSYYAIWKKPAITYTVSFNGNGGTGSTSSKSCTIPAVYNGATQNSSCSVTLPSSGYSYEGWAFHGWGTSSSSTSGTAAGTTISISSNITRYAIWYQPPISYTVTFNANGGTGNTNPVSCTIPSVFNGKEQDTSCVATLATSNGFTRSGWTFAGWGTSSSSTSGESLGARVTLTGNKTYYAIWKKPAITYTLSFESAASEASGSTASKTCTIPAVYNGATQGTSCSITLPSNGFSYSGWTFNGWGTSSTSTSGSGSGASVSISGNTTRYATWIKPSITYTISFYGNGGSGSTSPVSCTIPAVYNGATQASRCSVKLPSNGFSYSGWTFNGWGTSSTSTSGAAPGVANYYLSGDTVRYATWYKASKTYTASFSCNGGSGSVSSTSCTIPAVYNGATQNSTCSISTPSTGCSRSGWSFVGWSTSSSGTSGFTGSASINQDRSYYAVWKKPSITYTVSFYGNGGSGSTSSVSCTIPAVYNGATQDSRCGVTLPSNGFSYSGWTFNGWAILGASTSGSASGTSLSISSNTTRYATWRKTYTLTCSKGSNVSSIGASSRSCSVYNGSTSGCSVTLPSITPNSGYTSVGWSSSSGATSGTGAGSSITLTSNATRYANATDQTAPSCGSVTGAGSSSSWAKSRTITVACSESGGSGCSQASFSKTFNSGTSTSGTITISDNAGNTRSCSVATYVDNNGPACANVTGESSTWAKSRTVNVTCTDNNGSGCTQSEYSQTFNSGTAKTKTVTIYDKVGNSASCTVSVYIDNNGPSCGSISGASTTWTSSSRQISVGCSDSGGSGCTSSTFSKTFSDVKVGTITIKDNVGNSTSCSVNAYSDTTKPSISCTVGSGGTSGVSATVSASENLSGLTTNPSGSKSGLKETTTYTATNGAGLSSSCTVSVTKSAYDYYRKQYKCATASWNSPTVSYTSMSGCSSSGGGAMDGSRTTCTTISNGTCTSNGQSIPCLKKQYSTRKGCSSWSSTVSSTTYPKTCTASTGSYYKYTCSIRTYTYSGS